MISGEPVPFGSRDHDVVGHEPHVPDGDHPSGDELRDGQHCYDQHSDEQHCDDQHCDERHCGVDSRRGRGRRAGAGKDRSQRGRRAGGPRPPEEPASVDLAREAALRILTNAAQPSAAVANKLAAKGFEDAPIQAVIERFIEVGLLNDLDYARSLVRERRDGAGRSRRAILDEMRTKGIASQTAEAAIEEYSAEFEYYVAAEFVRRKRLRAADLADPKTARRMFAALARRGFSPDVISAALRETQSEGDEVDS